MCEIIICEYVYFNLFLQHSEMLQSCPDGGGFFRRALGDVVGFLFGRIVVDPNREAERALGLGDLEAGDLEAEFLLHVILDLLVGGGGLGGSQVQL